MIVWYLYIAVLLQSGHADVTYAYPYSSEQICQAERLKADALLAAEAAAPDATNAAQSITFCKAMEFTAPDHHVPAKDEA